jgi:hypothetical protein
MQTEESTEQVLSSQLGHSEELLWSGRPRQGVYLQPRDGLLIPFSLMWGGFAIFWEFAAVKKGPWVFEIWGIPFVLMGLYLIVGRFFADAMQRAKTYYGLTSERVIIVSGVFSRNVRSLRVRSLLEASLSEKTNGTGTITFGPAAPVWAGSGWPGSTKYAPPTFESIPHAREVFDRIRSAQKDA